MLLNRTWTIINDTVNLAKFLYHFEESILPSGETLGGKLLAKPLDLCRSTERLNKESHKLMCSRHIYSSTKYLLDIPSLTLQKLAEE